MIDPSLSKHAVQRLTKTGQTALIRVSEIETNYSKVYSPLYQIITPAASGVLESSLLLLRGPQHRPGACRRPPRPQAAPRGGSGPAASAPARSLCYPWCSAFRHIL